MLPLVRPLVWTIAATAAFGLLALYRFAVATGDFRNSDDAGTFLAGVEMAEGNWRLHGWVMVFDSYYPTDVLGLALLKLLFGWHPIFMQGLEALIWAAIALVGTGLACVGMRSRFLPGTISIALALLAFNIFEHGWRDATITNIGSHGSTILLTLLAFALVVTGTDRPGTCWPRRPILRFVVFGLIMIAGNVADPIFKVVACLPVLVFSLLGLRRRQPWQPGLTRIAIVIGAAGIAHVLLTVNAHNGGFQSTSLSITLATFPQLLDHGAFAVESIARLLGAEFFGHSLHEHLAGGPVVALLRAPFVVMFAIAWAQVGARLLLRVQDWPDQRLSSSTESLEHLLWLSLSFCVASTCVTTVIINQACVRFFLPAAVTGSILAARRFGPQVLAGGYGILALLVSIVVSVLLVSPDPPRRVAAIPQIHRIIDILKRHDLRHGYAGYWEAAIVTVLSNREITSLPLYQARDGRLHPLGYLSNLDWFRGPSRDWHGRVFFISDQVNPTDVFTAPDEAVRREFGRPIERITVDRFVINIYDLAPHALAQLAPQGYGDSMGPFGAK